MTLHDYKRGRDLAAADEPFYGLIQAAMRRGDSTNAAILREAFPEVWAELQERYEKPLGLLPGDSEHEALAEMKAAGVEPDELDQLAKPICEADEETMRAAQCTDSEIRAHLVMHRSGKCPLRTRDEQAAYTEMVESLEHLRSLGTVISPDPDVPIADWTVVANESDICRCCRALPDEPHQPGCRAA